MLAFALAAAVGADGFNVHFLPAETTFLAIVDFAAVKDAGYWDEEIREAFNNALGQNGAFRRVSQTLALTPESAKTLTVANAANSGGGRPKTLFAITGEFPFEQASKALADFGEKGDLTTIKMHDQPVYFDHNERQAMYFTLLDAETLLLAEDRALIKDALDGLAEARKPSPRVEEWLKFEEHSDATVRLFAVLPPEAKKGFAQLPQFKALAEKMDFIQFAGHLGEEPHGKLRLKMADAAAATQMKTALDGLLLLGKMMNAGQPDPRAAEIFDKLSLRTDKASLEANLSLPKEMFEEMVKAQRQVGKEVRRKMRERQKLRAQPGQPAPPAEKKGAAIEIKIGS